MYLGFVETYTGYRFCHVYFVLQLISVRIVNVCLYKQNEIVIVIKFYYCVAHVRNAKQHWI